MLGNIFNFEMFNLKEMGNKLAKNPERIFLGAGDPASSKLWSKVTGKNYEPLVDQWGGASSDTYKKAEDAGIDTTAGKGMHNIARSIASIYAGGYGAGKLGMTGQGGLLGQQQGAQSMVPGQTDVMGASQGAQGGLLGKMGGMYNQYGKPAMEAYGMVQQMQGQPQQAPPSQPLVAQQDPIGQMLAQQQQMEEMRRRNRGLLGGGYGGLA